MTVREAAERRGVTTYYQLAKLLGTDTHTAAKYWNDETKVFRRDVLRLLCEKLECPLSDIVTFEID